MPLALNEPNEVCPLLQSKYYLQAIDIICKTTNGKSSQELQLPTRSPIGLKDLYGIGSYDIKSCAQVQWPRRLWTILHYILNLVSFMVF